MSLCLSPALSQWQTCQNSVNTAIAYSYYRKFEHENQWKLGRTIPKSDYRERERTGIDTQCTQALPMGDNGGSMAMLHLQTIPMAVKRWKL